jgi:hypothetical protein
MSAGPRRIAASAPIATPSRRGAHSALRLALLSGGGHAHTASGPVRRRQSSAPLPGTCVPAKNVLTRRLYARPWTKTRGNPDRGTHPLHNNGRIDFVSYIDNRNKKFLRPALCTEGLNFIGMLSFPNGSHILSCIYVW